ncbi:MAG: triose-phosphate isomerase [Candidatus Binatia bacterium]
MKPLAVGNWKMHGGQAEALILARAIHKGLRGIQGVEVAIAPPFTALVTVRSAVRNGPPGLAAQDVHWEESGAFTGEISANMLRELGCTYVLIGHSERRYLFGESDETVRKKMIASLSAGLRPILCIGETLQERRKGATTRVITRQLRLALKGLGKSAIKKIEIAYEPVWAIGTGHNATPDQVRQVHRRIREVLKQLFGKTEAERSRVLYGGSVRPDNAEELARLPEVNGALVGGASLKAGSFLKIVRCFASS